MKNLKKVTLVSCLVTLAACSAPQEPSAGKVALLNANFEDDYLTDTGSQGKSWQFNMQHWNGYRQGIMRPQPGNFASTEAPEGRNVAFLSFKGSWMAQEVGQAFLPDRNYQVQLLVGLRQDADFGKGGQYRLELFAGPTLLAGKTVPTPPMGQFVPDSLLYTAGSADAQPGQKLKLKVTNLSARQVNFDSVRFYSWSTSQAYTPPAAPSVAASAPAAPASTQTAAATGASAPSATPDKWQVVGYWNYDGADGQNLNQGLVWKEAPGSNLGMTWQAHLELKNHAQLPPKARSLWPVMINAKQRKVCANYPGYPTYSAFIDMPGSANDGIYLVAQCPGG